MLNIKSLILRVLGFLFLAGSYGLLFLILISHGANVSLDDKLTKIQQITPQEYLDGAADIDTSGFRFEELKQEVEKLSTIFTTLIILFIVFLALGLGILWVDEMHLGEWIRTFSQYSLFVTGTFAVGLLLIWLMAPQVIETTVQEALTPDIDEELKELTIETSKIMIEWINEVLLTPMTVFIVLAILNLFGTFTGFGVPEKK